MRCIIRRVNTIETVIIFRIQNRMPMRIGLARGMVMRPNHLVSSDFHRIARNGFLQFSHHAEVHIVVFASPTPVHVRITISTDQIREVEGRDTTEQCRIEQFVVELVDSHRPKEMISSD